MIINFFNIFKKVPKAVKYFRQSSMDVKVVVSMFEDTNKGNFIFHTLNLNFIRFFKNLSLRCNDSITNNNWK